MTIKELRKAVLNNLKYAKTDRRKKEDIARSEDFIWDRKNLKIIKKGQLDLL